MVTKSAEMSCNDVVTFFVNLLLGAVAQDLRLISQSGVMRKCYSRVSFILCVVAGEVCLCLPLSHLR